LVKGQEIRAAGFRNEKALIGAFGELIAGVRTDQGDAGAGLAGRPRRALESIGDHCGSLLVWLDHKDERLGADQDSGGIIHRSTLRY
jgi:hypothetical protein